MLCFRSVIDSNCKRHCRKAIAQQQSGLSLSGTPWKLEPREIVPTGNLSGYDCAFRLYDLESYKWRSRAIRIKKASKTLRSCFFLVQWASIATLSWARRRCDSHWSISAGILIHDYLPIIFGSFYEPNAFSIMADVNTFLFRATRT